jgi:poly(3-hydroxybutyrate) depolymerase
MLYSIYEAGRASMMPTRLFAKATAEFANSPLNPWSGLLAMRQTAATANVVERALRHYAKPKWDIEATRIEGHSVGVTPQVVMRDDWFRLVHFERDRAALAKAHPKGAFDPKLLIVAPMSGHYATLLRGTVEAFLPDHEVFITDWSNARDVPVVLGRFSFDSYVNSLRRMLAELGPQTHVIAVCQPGPPTLAAISLMAEDLDPATPASMIYMGSPIDTRRSPTVPNVLAEKRPLEWFAQNMIYTVSAPNAGVFRRVYPGFVQLASFMNMNWDRHVDAHWTFYEHMVGGDGDSAEKHEAFYDEYLAVMDLTEEFYIDTIDKVFQRHLLPRHLLEVCGRKVDPRAIRTTALMTVEGENDDISGIGQTQAAHDLCTHIPADKKLDYVQPSVGHYGVFNGRRFREEIAPRIREFIRANWERAGDPRSDGLTLPSAIRPLKALG